MFRCEWHDNSFFIIYALHACLCYKSPIRLAVTQVQWKRWWVILHCARCVKNHLKRCIRWRSMFVSVIILFKRIPWSLASRMRKGMWWQSPSQGRQWMLSQKLGTYCGWPDLRKGWTVHFILDYQVYFLKNQMDRYMHFGSRSAKLDNTGLRILKRHGVA